jgi:tryptophanyl-tRNA synthetase
MMKKIVLTGIKPSGTPHLGNYFGMIKPALDLVDEGQALYFIADETLFNNRRRIDRILTEGAVKARRIAAPVINNIRNRIGIRR